MDQQQTEILPVNQKRKIILFGNDYHVVRFTIRHYFT